MSYSMRKLLECKRNDLLQGLCNNDFYGGKLNFQQLPREKKDVTFRKCTDRNNCTLCKKYILERKGDLGLLRKPIVT